MHEIDVSSFELIVHGVKPMWTDVRSVGKELPVITTSLSVTVIAVSSAVDS